MGLSHIVHWTQFFYHLIIQIISYLTADTFIFSCRFIKTLLINKDFFSNFQNSCIEYSSYSGTFTQHHQVYLGVVQRPVCTQCRSVRCWIKTSWLEDRTRFTWCLCGDYGKHCSSMYALIDKGFPFMNSSIINGMFLCCLCSYSCSHYSFLSVTNIHCHMNLTWGFNLLLFFTYLCCAVYL
jgi:hypothetical protein